MCIAIKRFLMAFSDSLFPAVSPTTHPIKTNLTMSASASSITSHDLCGSDTTVYPYGGRDPTFTYPLCALPRFPRLLRSNILTFSYSEIILQDFRFPHKRR